VARALKSQPDASLVDVAVRGLGAAQLAARIELIDRSPWVLIDSAHTGASAAALAEVLPQIPARRSHMVLSISEGKDTDAILRSLLPRVDEVTVTRAEPLRSLAPEEVAKLIRAASARVDVRVVPNPHLALRAARESLGPEDLLCVTGSIYLAGIARGILSGSDPGGRVSGSRR
jgi:dihydrofolate synthase/folylpolyglutamate synthase